MSPLFKPGDPPEESRLALAAWNMLACLSWEGLSTVIALLGIEDVEDLVHQLLTIHHHQRKAASS